MRVLRSLDQFSTSPKIGVLPIKGLRASPVLKCSYNAPYFAYQKEGKFYGVNQGCCNHWDCPKCGQLRAKSEYGRIVAGCVSISETNPLYFITVTCRGAGLSVQEATARYLEWTNRLLDAARARAKKFNQNWVYVQVTEKQKRGHPHSHILTTFNPMDTYSDWVHSRTYSDSEIVDTWRWKLRSKWLQKAVVKAGLGEQYDISVVVTAKAASRYVAKYMFKESMFQDHYPKGWKRVRYSQSFPKLPERETNAFVLLSSADWQKLASLAVWIKTDSDETKAVALQQLRGHDILVG